MPFAREFQGMWGCEFHYGERGEIRFVKHLVTHPDKVRYLLPLSKGIPPHGKDGKPSDMPAFALLRERYGIAVGVSKSGTARSWPDNREMREKLHLQNLAPPDIRAGSELTRSIVLAVEAIGKQIQLRQMGRGE